MTNPTGQTYTAKLDGADAPMKGDPGITSVSVKIKGAKTRWRKRTSATAR